VKLRDIRIETTNGVLQVREYQHSGETIVFLHFGGSNMTMWNRVIPVFKDKYHLVLVDIKGHGKSSKPDKEYHIDVLGKEIMEVLDFLNIYKTNIIGSSIGAEIGLSMSANYPERVLSLVCEGALHSEFSEYGSWSGTEKEFNIYIESRIQQSEVVPERYYDTKEKLVDASRQVFEPYGWWNEWVEAEKTYDACKISDNKYRTSWSKAAILDYSRYYFSYKFEDYYKRISCPLLMLPGAELLKNEKAKAAMYKLSSLSPNSVVIIVKDWVHPYGWMLSPDEMCAVVLEFIGNDSD
jgi:pimeloyl-ACP methyl ester carboxylesterase